MNPLRRAIHFFMETTRLDRCLDAELINRRHETWRAGRHPTLTPEASNQWVRHVLQAGAPAAIGKLEKHECAALAAHLGLRQFYKYTWAAPSYSEAGLPQAGIFPATDEMYWRFGQLMLQRLGTFDGLALLSSVGESRVLAEHGSQAQRHDRLVLSPYVFDQPWTAELAGKRVLVIHPHEARIKSQFANRAQIWPRRPSLLPTFDLDVAQSPHGSFSSGFKDWFAMTEWFEQRIEAIYRRWHFDVALIGCGAGGLPMAAFVKQLGAIGIDLGEALPVLFGIQRANAAPDPKLVPFLTAAWVSPPEQKILSTTPP